MKTANLTLRVDSTGGMVQMAQLKGEKVETECVCTINWEEMG